MARRALRDTRPRGWEWGEEEFDLSEFPTYEEAEPAVAETIASFLIDYLKELDADTVTAPDGSVYNVNLRVTIREAKR